MKRALIAMVFGMSLLAQADGAEPSAEAIILFEKKVRPVLVEHCQRCHGAEGKTKGGLSLISREDVLKGGDTGAAIVPGKPAQSLLIRAVRHEGELRMPPKTPLKVDEVAALEKWIEMGAPWPGRQPVAAQSAAAWDWQALRRQHWAWQPVQTPAVPAVSNTAWPRSFIDRWILARLEARGMTPAPPADRRTLIRRASLDLTGLPPTPEQVDAFVRDDAPEAFTRVVDRLLASPRYGERWGRYWLDVARYNDGHGNRFDGPDRPDAFRYRDWVVEALNRDLPFDTFVKQQIAGDLLGGPETAVATGFLALGPIYKSDGGDPDSVAKARAETLDDRIDTLSRGLLGLTVSCARCHDHKFDPISTGDYYSLAGIFHSTQEVDRPLVLDEASRLYDQAQEAFRGAERQVNELTAKARNTPQGLAPAEKKQLAELRNERDRLQKAVPSKPPGMHVLADIKRPTDLPIARRGNPRQPGELVPRQFLRILAGESAPPFTRGSGRLELADAIISPSNPLTPRVLVNRVWMLHFGKALVRTPDNFGNLGARPTHPELLDALAGHFVRSGWSLKELHRTIMLSATYQMSSAYHAGNFARDGDNELLWRMNPRRLDVEALRDSMLAVTGELSDMSGGAPDRELLPSRRRTLYLMVSRNGDHFDTDQFLRLWDFPTPRATSVERATTSTPQQYLFLLNSPFMLRRGQALSARLAREADDTERRIERAYQLVFGRPPTVQEVRADAAFLAAGGSGGAWAQYAQMLLASAEFLHTR